MNLPSSPELQLRRRRRSWQALALGLAGALAFAGLAGVNLSAQGPRDLAGPFRGGNRLIGCPLMSERPWRVGLCGTFDVENYGDLLFPLIAEAELAQRLGRVELQCFSYRAKSAAAWPFPVTSVTELPRLAGGLDGLLVGGGHVVRFDKYVAPGYGPGEPAQRGARGDRDPGPPHRRAPRVHFVESDGTDTLRRPALEPQNLSGGALVEHDPPLRPPG